MYKLRIAVAAIIVLGATAGAASAAGVFHHPDPAKDQLQVSQEALEAKFEARSAGTGASASAVRRGPQGKRGPKGARGQRGPQGPAGAKGTFGAITQVSGPPTFLCSFFAGSCAVGSTQVACPPGTVLIGGGYTGAGIVTTVTWSSPVGNSWGIIAVNLDEVPVTNLRATAQCAS